MGQIEDLKLYVTVVDSGGIARAADELGIVKSAVSRRLAQLEARFDVRLIDRQPGIWEVTSAGHELYFRAQSMVEEADDLDADFIQSAHSLRGTLTVSIAREFGLSYLRPMIFDFMRTNPEIDLMVDFDDRTVDLNNENYDLAVRITGRELTGYHHDKIGVSRHGLYASPNYAETNGLPKTPAELTGHPLLNYGAARRAKWAYKRDGKEAAVTFQPALNSNSGPFLLDALMNDFGIARLPDFIVDSALRDGAIVSVLPELEFEVFGIFIVHSEKRRINRRMRAFMAALQECCAKLNQK